MRINEGELNLDVREALEPHAGSYSSACSSQFSDDRAIALAPAFGPGCWHVDALTRMLDIGYANIQDGDSHAAFRILGRQLTTLFNSCATERKREELKYAARGHNIFPVLMQDPYSRRAFEKPRGYAGDAVMLDFVYAEIPPTEITPIGRTVYRGTARGPMGLSVVYRKQLLTAYITQTFSTTLGARLLSVASGHLRELDGTDFSDTWNRASEVVAIDQDSQSCEVVCQKHASGNVRVINDSIRCLLGRKAAALGVFDFAYSAGLFDYLATGLAARLMSSLAALVAPGGKLLIANFLPQSFGRGYMELILDWRLHYRSLKDIIALNSDPDLDVTNSFEDPHANVGYVVWTRRAS